MMNTNIEYTAIGNQTVLTINSQMRLYNIGDFSVRIDPHSGECYIELLPTKPCSNNFCDTRKNP